MRMSDTGVSKRRSLELKGAPALAYVVLDPVLDTVEKRNVKLCQQALAFGCCAAPMPAPPMATTPKGNGAWRTRILRAERRAALLIGAVYRWKKASYFASEMQEHSLGVCQNLLPMGSRSPKRQTAS